ncbi:MAG: S41 family peptidase [Bacteroidota bacterium]
MKSIYRPTIILRIFFLIPLLFLASCGSERALKRDLNKQAKSYYKAFNHLSLPEQTFEHLWHVYENYYALFEEKNVDWNAMYTTYRPEVSSQTSEKELIAIFANMLNPLKDGHVRLIKNGKNAIQLTRRTSYFARNFQDRLGEFHENTTDVLKSNGFSKMNLSYRSYSYEEFGLTHLFYYTNSDRLAYVKIVECIHNLDLLDQILSSLAEKEGLILDLRYNLGGSVGKEMGARFIEKDKGIGFVVQKGPKGFLPPRNLSVKASSPNRPKAMVVLVSDATFSAAEEFVMTLKGEKHITIIGTKTGGYLSDVFNYRLPNGINTWLSHQKYYSNDFALLEDKGISPDIWMENTPEDLDKTRDPLIEKALDLLNTSLNK